MLFLRDQFQLCGLTVLSEGTEGVQEYRSSKSHVVQMYRCTDLQRVTQTSGTPDPLEDGTSSRGGRNLSLIKYRFFSLPLTQVKVNYGFYSFYLILVYFESEDLFIQLFFFFPRFLFFRGMERKSVSGSRYFFLPFPWGVR